MARSKETIWQRDFSLGSIRPEAVERDDTQLIDMSVKEGLNTITLTTGQLQSRPGTVSQGQSDGAVDVFEVDLGEAGQFVLHIKPTGYEIHDTSDAIVKDEALFGFPSSGWTNRPGLFGSPLFADLKFWVIAVPDLSTILVGSKFIPTQAISVDDAGTWTIGEAEYSTSQSGAILQPYYRHYPTATIQPSALTGTITVTASESIWTDDHEGLYIRYVDKTILLGTRVSATVMNATVIEELPPTLDITVGSASGYNLGDAVEHDTLGGLGIITGISGTTITVLVTSKYDGFPASGKLVAPNAAQTISASVAATTKADTFLWDIQMFSRVHGYAGSAALHQGRLYLSDCISATQAYAVSDVGAPLSFTLGPNDADGFVEIIGSDRGGALKYVVSAEDLVFLTTRGIYYQGTRDGSAVTPTTIAPKLFTSVGCADVRPTSVDDGVIFIDSAGQQVWAAVLTGDVYKSWRAQMITKYHGHLTNSPVSIGATSSGAETPEQFIYVVNSDGTAAVCQWDRDDNKISWRLWDTLGNFIVIKQIFGVTRAIVERSTEGAGRFYRETFHEEAYLDAVSAVEVSTGNLAGLEGEPYWGGTTSYATQFFGTEAAVYFEGWYYGVLTIDSNGRPLDANGDLFDYQDYDGIVQVGALFTVRVTPWARRSVNTQRGSRQIKRIIDLYVTVQTTGVIEIDGEEYGAYRVDDDLSVPPPLRDDQYRVGFSGGDLYEANSITRTTPGPFRLLKLGYRVVV